MPLFRAGRPKDLDNLHIRSRVQGGVIFEGKVPPALIDQVFNTPEAAYRYGLEQGLASVSYSDVTALPIYYYVPQVCRGDDDGLYNPLHGTNARLIGRVMSVDIADISKYEEGAVFWGVYRSGLDSYCTHIHDFLTEKAALECKRNLFERLN